MKREEKAGAVNELSERLGRAKMVLVSEYRALTAEESTEMRRRFRAVRGEFKVAKNTFIRRAIRETPFGPLDEKLGGPVALVFSFEDPVEVAKTALAMRELAEKFTVRGGVLDGRPLSLGEVQTLAALPPREVVMAQLLGLLMAPAQRLVRLLNEPGSALARLLDAAARKRGETAQGGAEDDRKAAGA